MKFAKTIHLFMFTMSMFWCHSVMAADKPLKVYILAGQSNMQGHASISTFDSLADDPKTAPLLKEMRGPDGKPKLCEKVWISSVGCLGDAYSDLKEKKGKLTAGFGAPENKIGPEFTFGITMEKLLDEPILIIKTSWGGRSLHTDFRSPSAGPFVLAKETQELWDKHPKGAHGIPKTEDRPKFYTDKVAATGVYYREMIAHVKKVLKDVKRVVPDYDEKQGYELAGFVWFQGFNDLVDGGVYPNQGKAGGYDLYADLLGHFIRDVRRDLSVPKLPFVIGVMGIDGLKGDKKGSMMHFRDAQRKPATLAEFKGNVIAVETAPFWDDDLNAFVERKKRVYDKLEQEFRKANPKPTEPEKEAARKKALDEEFKPEELKRLKTGVSNGGYHYLGAAKILAPIGKAFAETIVVLSKGEKPKDSSTAKPAEKTGSDDRFSVSNVEGWTIYINSDVPRQYPGETARTLEHLKWELYQVKLAAPALAVTNMQEKNAIWIEYKEKVDLSYHPGRSWLMDKRYSIPRDPESLMSLSVATHVGDSYRHPFVVFHEFAHGYDFHFIGKGKDYGNKESQTHYERMMKEGKYEKVKIWNGKVGSHYARSNRMEYWAESTEAYFAVNDFYPFVRAQLREHDPQMAKFIERYWGVNPELVVQQEKVLVAYLQELPRSGAEMPKRARDPSAVAKYTPTNQYEKRMIDGWTVYVSPRLVEQPGVCATMITLLNYKLHMINHFVGNQGLKQLQEVPIWLEVGGAGSYVRYCGSSQQLTDEMENPDKFRAVEVSDPQRMLKWALLQQSDLLHQLALATYDRLEAKDADLVKKIRTAYQKAKKSNEYKSVLRFDGQRAPHPAMSGEKEYFAELMKCYFLVNDHYPFVRCELKDHDPTGYGLIAALWEGNPAR